MASTPLRRVERLSARIEALSAERELEISRARTAGSTWAEIGHALGCSAQGAHKRYRWVRHSERTATVWHEPPLSV